MKINKEMQIGDIYLNPIALDLWILRKEYSERLDREKWVLHLVHTNYTEDYECVDKFIRVGNIYDLVNKKLEEEDVYAKRND